MTTRRRRHLRLVRIGMTPLPKQFEAFIEHLVKAERRAPATIDTYRTALGDLVRWCEDAGIDPLDITHADLDQWQSAIGGRLAPSSQDLYTCKVRRTYAWLASRRSGRIIAENPADELTRPDLMIAQFDPIPDDDLALLLQATPESEPLHCWYLLEAGTGIRPVQMASLTRRRVRYEGGRALLTVRGKGREMVVLAGPDVAQSLRRWTREAVVGPLWHNAHGRPVTARNIVWAMNRQMRRLGIDYTSHGLRRWFADHAGQLADLRTVQDLLGHASPVTTARYMRPNTKQRVDVADALSAQLGQASGRCRA